MAQLFSVPDSDLTVVPAVIGGFPVKALVDSGASRNFVLEKFWAKTQAEITEPPSSVEVADGKVVLSLGACRLNLFISISEFLYPETRFAVMESLAAPVILGREFLGTHSSVSLEYGGPLGPLKIPAKVGENSKLKENWELNKNVSDYSGCYVSSIKKEAPSPFSSMHPNTVPLASPSRRYKPEDVEFIKSEVKRLLESGIIEPCQSPCRAQVLVVKNRTKRRMAVDYFQSVNRYTFLDVFPFPVIDELAQQMSQYKFFRLST